MLTIFFIHQILVAIRRNRKYLSKENLSRYIKQQEFKLRATSKEYVSIKAIKAQYLQLRQSKFGGMPYFPKDAQYPKDNEGRFLYLIAQFNMNEVPNLSNYPSSGILQFYIIGNYSESLYHPLEKNIGSDKFRIIYFPYISDDDSQLITDFSFLPKQNRGSFIFDNEFELAFEKKKGIITIDDYRFNEIMERKLLLLRNPYEVDIIAMVHEATDLDLNSHGHKLGGFPHFEQSDPRYDIKKAGESYELLFQMDSQDMDILWGDAGVGNFFIKESDLKKLDFSKVLFYWDCG